MSPIYTAGRRGAEVRSDCWVAFQPRRRGDMKVTVRSRVAAMYGEAIHRQVREVLASLGVGRGEVEIDDAGALPWTIAARVEGAVRRWRAAETGADLPPSASPTYLPEMKSHCLYPSPRDRLRRSRLYLPGNEPKFMVNAGLHKPDGVILDLEDSVAPAEKDAARILVRNALRQVNFYGAERMVRINQGEAGMMDLEWVAAHNVHVVLIPKCESAEQVQAVEAKIRELLPGAERTRGGRADSAAPVGEVYLMPIIESALGAVKSYEIASASPQVVALAIGLEDYTADLGVQRTLEGRESLWMRGMVVNAARASGVAPIDTVFSDVGDMEGLRRSVQESKALGFEGRGCIHPRQIPVIHQAFLPDPAEVERARRIVAAYEEAQAKGLGVVALGTKMIDPPVVKRALRTVRLAEAVGRG